MLLSRPTCVPQKGGNAQECDDRCNSNWLHRVMKPFCVCQLHKLSSKAERKAGLLVLQLDFREEKGGPGTHAE